MEITEMLDELKSKARRNENLRAELLETRKAPQPLSAFCQKCRELGYEIYDMDLLTAGEEFYATMRRSTNGGGENSPMLEGEDDFYELFFAGLELKNIPQHQRHCKKQNQLRRGTLRHITNLI